MISLRRRALIPVLLEQFVPGRHCADWTVGFDIERSKLSCEYSASTRTRPPRGAFIDFLKRNDTHVRLLTHQPLKSSQDVNRDLGYRWYHCPEEESGTNVPIWQLLELLQFTYRHCRGDCVTIGFF
jgi:hypothetical protein